MAESDDDSILSQDEIDSLLDASEPEEGTGEAQAKEEPPEDVAKYDFRRPKLITQERLELFARLHNTFTSELQARLFQMLHSRTDVTSVAFDQQQYKSYVASLNEVIFARLLELAPLPGLVVMEMSPSLIIAFDDILLGGPGEAPEEDRELTDTELAIAEPVLGAILESLRQTFSTVADIEGRAERDESNPEYLQAALPDTPMVTLNFQVASQQCQGALSLCYPLPFVQYVLEETGGTQPESGSFFRGGEEGQQDVDMLSAIADAPLHVDVLLGETQISARDWLNLKEGDVLLFGTKVDDPATVRVANRKIYFGSPGTAGENLAIKIRGSMEET